MASVKQKHVQIIGLIEDQSTLQEAFGNISCLNVESPAEVPDSSMLFSQDGTVPIAQELELTTALGGLTCMFSISDPPEAAGGLFGKRKKAAEEVRPVIHGLDKVTGWMLEITEAQIKALQTEADSIAAEILTEYDKEAEAVYWKHAAAGKKAIDQTAQGLSDTAAMESRKQVLAFKRELVEKTFDLALERLSDLSEEKYVKLLATLCVQAAESGQERLIFSTRDRGHYGKRVTIAANEMLEVMGRTGSLTMSEETREIRGGVIVTDGLIDVNCSMEALVEANRRELIIPVSEMLFEKEAAR